MSTPLLRKIFTAILIVYAFNLLGRLMGMDKQFLDGTLNTGASTEATIIFVVYSSLTFLVGILILIIGWPFKWLRYLMLLAIVVIIGLLLNSQELTPLITPILIKIHAMVQTLIQSIKLILPTNSLI